MVDLSVLNGDDLPVYWLGASVGNFAFPFFRIEPVTGYDGYAQYWVNSQIMDPRTGTHVSLRLANTPHLFDRSRRGEFRDAGSINPGAEFPMLIQRQAGFRILDSLALIVFSVVMALTGCGSDSHPVDRETLERMAAELEGRSFRQFDPLGRRQSAPRSGS